MSRAPNPATLPRPKFCVPSTLPPAITLGMGRRHYYDIYVTTCDVSHVWMNKLTGI